MEPLLALVTEDLWKVVLETLRMPIAGNTVGQVLTAVGIFILAVLIRNTVVSILFNRLEVLTRRTSTEYDEKLLGAIRAPVKTFVVVLGFFVGATVLALPEEANLIVGRLFQGASLTVGLWAVLRSVDVLVEALGALATRKGMQLEPFLPLIKKAARVFTALIGVVLIIQNLGYSVSSLLAGLGIGGLAVALAAQDSLANLFGSVTIAADLPFKVGDHVKTGAFEGIVEEVGMRSTKIRTFENSLVQIPNKNVANDSIENFSRRQRRRVRQVLGLTYSTTPEQIDAILADIRALLRADKELVPDTASAFFLDFGASSLDLQVVYFTQTIDFAPHHEIRQRLNLEFMRIVQRNGSSFAFPTRTVHVVNER